jgi:L-alanine-DL-glutamate epimerase-like enolase superfamily enzyme
MRIAAVEPVIVDVPTREPVKGVHGVTRTQRSVLVRLATDRGIDGWGNVDPSPGYTLMSADEIAAAVRALAPVLAGGDAMNLNTALAAMDAAVAGAW